MDTKKLYAVAQFNEKSNFTHPSFNYILSLCPVGDKRVLPNYNQIMIMRVTFNKKNLFIVYRAIWEPNVLSRVTKIFRKCRGHNNSSIIND